MSVRAPMKDVPVKQAALIHYVEASRETVLHDATGNELLVLNELAAAVWLLIDNQRTVNEISNIVLEAIPSAPSSAIDEINSFLADLESRQLITWQ